MARFTLPVPFLPFSSLPLLTQNTVFPSLTLSFRLTAATAIFPPIICFFFTRDLPLIDAQNALDGVRNDGEKTGLGLVDTPAHLPHVPLRVEKD